MGVNMKITDIIGSTDSAKKMTGVSGKDTIIGANAQFSGNVVFTQKLRISGTVKGNVESNDDSDAEVLVDANGLVEGDLIAPTITLRGEVNGNVHSSAKIVIDASALITGNVYYDILEMHGGATVNGSLIRNMGKTAGLLEKKVESDSKNTDQSSSFLQSIDKKEK
jgi:cytoskeletal protein CcmA (bactofilin family)